MPSSYTTRQGQMWDQVALEELGDELTMSDVLAANVDEMDALVFSGDVCLTIPDEATPLAIQTLPPWERM